MSRLELVEGRRYATRAIEASLQGVSKAAAPTLLAATLTNLLDYLPGHPKDYQEGITQVVEEALKWI